jgi:hypothetical protein
MARGAIRGTILDSDNGRLETKLMVSDLSRSPPRMRWRELLPAEAMARRSLDPVLSCPPATKALTFFAVAHDETLWFVKGVAIARH